VRIAAPSSTRSSGTSGNGRLIADAIAEAAAAGRHHPVPELAITGIPEDSLLTPRIRGACASRTGARGGTVHGGSRSSRPRVGRRLLQRRRVVHDGLVRGIYPQALPANYGVFDEPATSGRREAGIIRIGGVRVGLAVCEDICTPPGGQRARAARADVIAASRPRRITAARRPARGDAGHPGRRRRGVAVFCNQVGDRTSWCSKGAPRSSMRTARWWPAPRSSASTCWSPTSTCRCRHAGGCASRCRATCRRRRSCRCGGSAQPAVHGAAGPRPPAEPLLEDGEVREALVTGLRDYVDKTASRA